MTSLPRQISTWMRRTNSAARRTSVAVAGLVKRGWTELTGTEAAATRKNAAFLRTFKADAVVIEEQPVPISIHATLYVLTALLAALILWSFIGTLDRIVIAQGKVTTASRTIVLQPFAVSRIQAIFVKPGARVRKGEVLMSFDPAFANADQSSLTSKHDEMQATQERIEAEIAGAPFVVAPGAGPERKTQGEIFQRRLAQLASELAQRDSAIKKVTAEQAANVVTVADLKKQVEVARKVTVMRKTLRDKQVGSELQLMTAQRDELDIQQRLQDAVSHTTDLEHELAQAVSERDAYLEDWRRQLNESLATTRQQAREASDALEKATRMKDFTSLTAPFDGVVLEVADRSVGSVLKEAETAVTMVPADAVLEVEADVQSKDVGYVAVGDPVRVKLEAYPFQKFGTLNGKLTVVSPDSIVRQVGQSNVTVFHVTVQLKDTVKQLAARGIRLGPGLVASSEISTGRRSIASYVLYPVMRMFDEGLREP